MKFYLVFISSVFLMSSCENQQKSEVQIREELQGMWLLSDSVSNDMKHFTLYFKDSICHVSYNQSNLNRYTIKDSILELKISTGSPTLGNQVRFKIISSDSRRMIVCPLSLNLKAYCEDHGIDTLKFYKVKPKNQFTYKTISFGSSGCFGTCPSFDLEINKSGEVVYNGYYFVKKEGNYTAKRNDQFYTILKDKLKYIDFNNLKKEYEAGWTDDQTVGLVVETDNKVYSVSVYGTDREPAQLRTVFEYVFSNYENLKWVKSNTDLKFKYSSIISRMGIPEMEETIMFLPPVVTDEE